MTETPRDDDSPSIGPHDVIWDDQRIVRFWDFMSQAATDEYFSSKYADEIASEVARRAAPVGVVADIGCGGGHLLQALRRHAVGYIGIDSSPSSIASARERLPDAPADALQVGSMTALPLADQSVDTVVLIEVVEHALDADLARIFAETRRILRPGGYIFITTRNAEDLSRETVMCPDCGAVFHRMQHVRSWSAESLADALSAARFDSVHASPHHFIGSRRMLERSARRIYYRLTRNRPDLVAVARRPPWD